MCLSLSAFESVSLSVFVFGSQTVSVCVFVCTHTSYTDHVMGYSTYYVCVCVLERERERECVCVFAHVGRQVRVLIRLCVCDWVCIRTSIYTSVYIYTYEICISTLVARPRHEYVCV